MSCSREESCEVRSQPSVQCTKTEPPFDTFTAVLFVAIMWFWNYKEDLTPDELTLHEGLEVKAGQKWCLGKALF